MEIEFPPNVPTSEFSREFAQGMANRMAVSYCKYGAVAEAYPSRVDAIGSLLRRLAEYLGEEGFRDAVQAAIKAVASDKSVGNTEWLMDVGNFAMIEFMHPKHATAHFRATDSKESPGRVWHGEAQALALPNRLEDHAR
jgi:hypothetical protein